MEEHTIAEGLMAVARAIQKLGTADAGTPMGGLEAHAVMIEGTGNRLAEALDGIGESISEVSKSLDSVAAAILEANKVGSAKKKQIHVPKNILDPKGLG